MFVYVSMMVDLKDIPGELILRSIIDVNDLERNTCKEFTLGDKTVGLVCLEQNILRFYVYESLLRIPIKGNISAN